MTENNEKKEQQKSSLNKIIGKYLVFIGMFVGAGFIAGSIVHLGEGINPWDISILIIGIVLFLASTSVQEFVFNKRSIKEAGVLKFLLYSLVLSLGVGMASGGTQHFVDTPGYSSYLIPIGLGLGMIAFLLKEKEVFTRKKWLQIISVIIISVIMLVWFLGQIGNILPESLLQGQGHDHGTHAH
jgi:MFS family permease